MAIIGNRIWLDDGTTLTYNGEPYDDLPFNNASVATLTGVPASGVFEYTFTRPLQINSMAITFHVDGLASTDYTLECYLKGEIWVSYSELQKDRFASGSIGTPGDTLFDEEITKLRLTGTGNGSGTRTLLLWNIYVKPEPRYVSYPGALYLADQPMSFMRPQNMSGRGAPGPMIRQVATRKLGQFFDQGTIPRSTSAHGEFYVYNSTPWTATTPTISATMPGLTQEYAHHMLFSINGTDWQETLTIPSIAPAGYSRKILFIDNTPSNAQPGATSTKVICQPGGWSGNNAPAVDPQHLMVATFHKNVDLNAPAKPDIWMTDPVAVDRGQAFTVYGRGLANMTWSYYESGKGWEQMVVSPVVATSSQTATDATGAQFTMTAGAPVMNIEVESVTLNAPVPPPGQVVRYPIRAQSATTSNQDVYHSLQVNPGLIGDLGLPPLSMNSSMVAALRPEGLTAGDRIEQRSSRFSRPELIVIRSEPQGIPDVLVNSQSSCEMILSSSTGDRLRSDVTFNTYGLARWYPHSTYIASQPQIGPTTMDWVSMDGQQALRYDNSMGISIDPMTEFGTALDKEGIIAPAMVFPRYAIAKRTSIFGNETLSTKKKIPNFTMIMVVLIGPDPSPEYREVAQGQPEQLATVPAYLMETTSNSATLPNTEVRYENRDITAIAGRSRSLLRIDNGFLGRRPVIIGVTVGASNVKGKMVPYTWVTYAGRRISRKAINQKEFSSNVTGQIGSSKKGDDFRVLDFLCGPHITQTQEDRIINSLSGIYGVLD